jgi:type VI secretion system protein ImpJ
MFMRPQHMQQMVRYTEYLVDSRVRATGTHRWGVRSLNLDEDKLATGLIAIRALKAVMPDGTVVNVPDDDDPPPPLQVPPETVATRVFLALPLKLSGSSEFTRDEVAEDYARYRVTTVEASDNTVSGSQRFPIEVGKLRLRLMLEHEDRNLVTSIPIARVDEVRPDRSIVMDDTFIAPCTDVQASSRLAGFTNELVGLLSNRAEHIVSRLGGAGQSGVADVSDFLLLQLVNRLEHRYRFLSSLSGVHPADLYGELTTTAGELATFTSEARRQSQFPPYRHDDLHNCFTPVIRALRQALSAALEENAIPLPLQEGKMGVRISPITDRSLITNARFIVAVSANMSPDELRRRFTSQVKIGPVEKIRQLVSLQLPGITPVSLSVAPRQLPYHAGFLYFQLDPGSPLWNELDNSGGFAFHLAGDFPGLQLEFWAVKQG